MLDDWQRRLEAAPKFGPTFEGFDYRTPEYERLAETRDAINRISATKDITPSEVQKTAQQFKDAFIANRQNLQKEFGSDVTPVNELLEILEFILEWLAKYGGMQASDAGKLRELESENAKLKKLLAEAHLDIHALKGVFGVKR